MKKKYRKITYDLYDDEKLIALLEEEAKQGWMLKTYMSNYLVFKQSEPKTLKYQIDYNEITSEYNEIISSLGYQFVCFSSNKNIYVNENINAEDLYNDEATKTMSMLQNYKLSRILPMILLPFGWAMLSYFKFEYFNTPFHELLFFPTHIILLVLFFFMEVLELLQGICMIKIRKYYKTKLTDPFHTTKLNPTLLVVYSISENISVALLPFMLLALFVIFIPVKFVYILWIIALTCSFLLLIDSFLIYKSYTRYLQMLVLGFLVVGIIFYPSFKFDSIDKDLYYQNKYDIGNIETLSDLLVRYQMVNTYFDYYEKNISCINEAVANQFFQIEIIKLDHYAKDNFHYDTNKTSFQKSIKNMKPLKHELIDEGYYNDKYVIVRNKNHVLSFQLIEGNDINDIISYYYK